MINLKGLLISDEQTVAHTLKDLFASEGIEIEYLSKLPPTVNEYYNIILELDIDFLIIEQSFGGQISYNGIDILKEVRKHDGTIYAILLTNCKVGNFIDFDYEVQKSKITEFYRGIAKKIKRAYGVSAKNSHKIEIGQPKNSKAFELLNVINANLDS